MAIKPVVRYMLLCDDWRPDPGNAQRVTVVGRMSNIRPTGDPPFPMHLREFCVLLFLTEGRGTANGQIVCVVEETGERVFETANFPISFGPDPLEVVGVPVRIRDRVFPRPGLYSIQFWYAGELVDERPLRMR